MPETAAGRALEKRFDGPVILVQTDTDPGDMGEPREVWDDVEQAEVVFVPSFDLWPRESRFTVDAIVGMFAITEGDEAILREAFDGVIRQARALGRAEALAAVRAAVGGLAPPSVTRSTEREAAATIAITLRHVLAAIDSLETP